MSVDQMPVSVVMGGFGLRRARLQPWRHLADCARALAADGHPVRIWTDVAAAEAGTVEGCAVTGDWPVPRPGSHGRRPDRAAGPSIVAWSVGRLAPLASPPRDPADPGDVDVAVLTAPLYSWGELMRMARACWRQPGMLGLHVLGALVPRQVLARHLRTRYAAVIVLAPYAADRLVAAGLPRDRVAVIPPVAETGNPRTDSTEGSGVRAAEPQPPTHPTFVFAGNASPARGADLAVRAFALAFADDPASRLCLALRREDEALAADDARVRTLVARLGLAGRVEILGNLAPADVRDRFAGATAVVLPFRLVPSEAPVMPLEIDAVGGRLITADLPPLRAVAGPGSLFVRPGDVRGLACALHAAAARTPALPATDALPSANSGSANLVRANRVRAPPPGWTPSG